MTCPKCGRQVSDRTVFCPNCGLRLQAPGRPVRSAAPVPQSAPKPENRPAFSLPFSLNLRKETLRILSFVCCGTSLLAMILWLTIGFKIDIGIASEKFSLYYIFFSQCHTTFLSVFVVLGFLANAACMLLPQFPIPFVKKATAYKIALQSIIVSNVLGMCSLNAAIATSGRKLLDYMNFSGWTCFIFALASLVLTALVLWQSKNKK